MSTCRLYGWGAPLFDQGCGWLLLTQGSGTSSPAAARADSCCGPSGSTPPLPSEPPETDEDRGGMSESLKPPGRTLALPHSGAHWLGRWSPADCLAAVSSHQPTMTVKPQKIRWSSAKNQKKLNPRAESDCSLINYQNEMYPQESHMPSVGISFTCMPYFCRNLD